MRTRVPWLLVWLLVGVSAPAGAQFRAANQAPGEDFNAELSVVLWQPEPQIQIQTGALAAAGENAVDFVREFGIEKKRLFEFRATLKGSKHKARVSYVPMRFQEDAVLERTITFGSRTFPVSIPATADLRWDLWRFGYEYDFAQGDRGFFGLVTELKHNTVSADLVTSIGSVEAKERVPVPAIGFIGRGYLHRNFSVTAEFTTFKIVDVVLPDRLADEFDASFTDVDVYGTMNFGRHVGVQGGYRYLHADYLVDEDAGDLKMNGLYFGGVVRF